MEELTLRHSKRKLDTILRGAVMKFSCVLVSLGYLVTGGVNHTRDASSPIDFHISVVAHMFSCSFKFRDAT